MSTPQNLLIGGTPRSALTDAALLILRVVAGLALALGHGLGKLPPSEGFIGGVEALGFPAPAFFAWASGLAETVGGLLLAVGLLTRPAAFFVVCNMAVAFFLQHADDPFSGKEKALLYALVGIVFLLIGAGRYSIDSMLRGRTARREVADSY